MPAKRITKTKVETKPMSYREYVKEMFKKRPAGVSATDYMREIAMKWKNSKTEMKGLGNTLLLEPGLGQTSANYVGSGSCCC